MPLLEHTQELLSKCLQNGYELMDISTASDGSVQHEWLKKFANGKIKNPGVNSVQALHDVLLTLKTRKAKAA